MKIKWLASAFLCTGLMYCGGGSGGSGVDGGELIGGLSAAEAEDLCDYLVTRVSARTVTCDVDGQTITLEFGATPEEIDEEIGECVAEINALPTCNATVGEAEACAEGNAAQLDDLSDAEICELILSEEEPPPIAACEALDDPSCELPE